jgi:hypothetical protein
MTLWQGLKIGTSHFGGSAKNRTVGSHWRPLSFALCDTTLFTLVVVRAHLNSFGDPSFLCSLNGIHCIFFSIAASSSVSSSHHPIFQGRLVPSLAIFDFRGEYGMVCLSLVRYRGDGVTRCRRRFPHYQVKYSLLDDSTFNPFLVIVHFQFTLIGKGKKQSRKAEAQANR